MSVEDYIDYYEPEYDEFAPEFQGIRKRAITCNFCLKSGLSWISHSNTWWLAEKSGELHLCETWRAKRARFFEQKKGLMAELTPPTVIPDEPKLIYVAVVMVKGQLRSLRTLGDYACFTGEIKADVVRRALEAKAQWTSKNQSLYTQYCVLVGELTEEAQPIPQYEMRPLQQKE